MKRYEGESTLFHLRIRNVEKWMNFFVKGLTIFYIRSAIQKGKIKCETVQKLFLLRSLPTIFSIKFHSGTENKGNNKIIST